MVEIWEENPTDQNIPKILECLNDKLGNDAVFLVLNEGIASKKIFNIAKQDIEINWPYNVALLWLKTVSKLPDELKDNLESFKELKAVVLNKKREVKSSFKKTDIVDIVMIDASLFNV